MKHRIGTTRALITLFLALLHYSVAQGLASMLYLLPITKLISPVLFALVYIFLVSCGVKLLSEKLLKQSLKACHIDRPHVELKWIQWAIILPISVTIILLLFPGEWFQTEMTAKQVIETVLMAFFGIGMGPGIAEELVFRGLILKALEMRWGKGIAIFVTSLLFALLHTVGLSLNGVNFWLLVIGGTSVGVMFALIVYSSGSIWNSAVVHGLWNIIMVGGILQIAVTYDKKAIFSYKLFSKSIILTGGKFGVEVSIVAILCYWVVITFILYTSKRRTQKKSPF